MQEFEYVHTYILHIYVSINKYFIFKYLIQNYYTTFQYRSFGFEFVIRCDTCLAVKNRPPLEDVLYCQERTQKLRPGIFYSFT